MRATTPIAIMVERMLAAGVAAEAVVAAVEAQESVQPKPPSRSKQLVLFGEDSARRGARLSAEWRPTPEGLDYALGMGLSQQLIAIEAEKFKNYWTAKTGANATKRDWEATWRNWIITAMEGRHGRAKGSLTGRAIAGSPPAGADAVLSGMGRIAARLSQI